MESGDYAVACDRFRESFRLQAAVGTLLNLGACEEKREHFAVGLQCFRDALSMLGDGDFRRSYAEEHLAALNDRIAFVRVTVAGDPPQDMRIRRDGIELGASILGIEFSVDPGEHTFTASAPGFASFRTTFTVAEREHREVSVRLSPQRKDHALSQDDSSVRSPSKLGPYLVMGTGGAALVAGTIFGIVVANAASDVRTHCKDTGCDGDAFSAARRGKPYALMSPLFLGAGVALAAGGFVWLKLSRRASVTPSVSGSSPSAGATLTVPF